MSDENIPLVGQDGSSLGDWVGAFAERAREFAHEEEHWIDIRLGETPEKYKDHLKYKLRLEGWTTAITMWYTVDQVFDGGVWKHLSMQVSQYMDKESAATIRAQMNTYKATFLELFDPIVRAFFPMNLEVATKWDIADPIPVANPETKQITFRVPMTFHFLVPFEGDLKPTPMVNVATDTEPVKLKPGEGPKNGHDHHLSRRARRAADREAKREAKEAAKVLADAKAREEKKAEAETEATD